MKIRLHLSSLLKIKIAKIKYKVAKNVNREFNQISIDGRIIK